MGGAYQRDMFLGSHIGGLILARYDSGSSSTVTAQMTDFSRGIESIDIALGRAVSRGAMATLLYRTGEQSDFVRVR